MLKTGANKQNEKQNLIVALICVIIISGIFMYKNAEKKKMIEKGGAYAVSVGLGNTVQHRVMKLTPNNAQYLKNSKEYGSSYSKGKLLVIYPYPDGNSPFSKVFSDEFDKVMRNPKYTANYDFLTFPENPNNQFFQTCHSICFVNPKKEEILYITRASNEAGQKLQFIMDGLLSW